MALIPVAITDAGFRLFDGDRAGRLRHFLAGATIYGVSAIVNIEPQLLDVGRVLRLGNLERITKIILPATLPRYFVAFRLAAAVALDCVA